MLANKFFLLWLWIISFILILLAYLFLDRSISSFIYAHHWRECLSNSFGLEKIVEWPPVLEAISPVLFFVLLFFSKSKSKLQKMLLLMTLSVMLTYLLKNDLKWIFSRDWPETWRHHNFSWISNQAYGFQWFQGGFFKGDDATGSFPSGHSSIAFASLLAVGLYYRRGLWFCLLLASLEGFSMVAFDYHFLSDVIAGACLGMTVTILCDRIFYPSLRKTSAFMPGM